MTYTKQLTDQNERKISTRFDTHPRIIYLVYCKDREKKKKKSARMTVNPCGILICRNLIDSLHTKQHVCICRLHDRRTAHGFTQCIDLSLSLTSARAPLPTLRGHISACSGPSRDGNQVIKRGCLQARLSALHPRPLTFRFIIVLPRTKFSQWEKEEDARRSL